MPRNSVNRPVRTQSVLALCAAVALSACSAKYSQVPPRLDLAPYGRVALITFAADERADSALSAMATRRFAEALLAGQRGVELLELDPADSSLRAIRADDGPALARAVGRDKDVPAVFVGALRVSGVKPRGQLASSGVNLRATVSAELSVRLVSTRTGGTVWRSTAATEGTVGRLAISDGLPQVIGRGEEEAYGEMVGNLVASVSRDLRPSWVKR